MRRKGRIKERIFAGLLMLPALLCFFATAAFAEEADEIKSVSVTVSSQYGEPGELLEPEIKLSSGLVLDSIKYQKNPEKWTPGEKIRTELVLSSEDGRLFAPNFSRSSCKVSGANFVRAISEEDTLTVRIDYIPVAALGYTEKAGWNSNHTKAVWKKVRYAPGYTIELYGDDKKIKSFKNVTGTSFDLSEYVKDEDKTYYYEIKAVPLTAEQKKYLKEGEFVTSSSYEFEPETPDSGSPGRGTGSGWQKSGEGWYYLDSAGRRATGWLQLGGIWYYMGSDGIMSVGWRETASGRWSYFLESGALVQNSWIQPVPEKWYYLDADGYMLTGWFRSEDGSSYYLAPGSGEMNRGWALIGGSWYYFGMDGRMARGWLNDGGRWYYLDASGKMLTDTQIDGRMLGRDGSAQN